jgi:hypothetical protein
VDIYVHEAWGSKMLPRTGEVKSRFMYDMQFVESHNQGGSVCVYLHDLLLKINVLLPPIHITCCLFSTKLY